MGGSALGGARRGVAAVRLASRSAAGARWPAACHRAPRLRAQLRDPRDPRAWRGRAYRRDRRAVLGDEHPRDTAPRPPLADALVSDLVAVVGGDDRARVCRSRQDASRYVARTTRVESAACARRSGRGSSGRHRVRRRRTCSHAPASSQGRHWLYAAVGAARGRRRRTWSRQSRTRAGSLPPRGERRRTRKASVGEAEAIAGTALDMARSHAVVRQLRQRGERAALPGRQAERDVSVRASQPESACTGVARSSATEGAMTRGLSVDIIVNNFNYGSFLEAAIDSALAQDHAAVRVIAVDDGSTDDSRAIIASYGDRITPVLKNNGGQAAALNAGFEHSKGDVVMFLDADDVLLPSAARLVVDAFTADPRRVKVQYRMEVIDAAGRPSGAVKPPQHLPMPSGDFRAHELAFPLDLTWLPTSGNAFAGWALQRLLPIPEDEFAPAADWYLQHLTPLLGPVASLTEIGAQFRTHGANDYEPPTPTLDLEHVRKSVVYAAATRHQLEEVAGRFGLGVPRGGIVSVSDIANRMISLRLDHRRHP